MASRLELQSKLEFILGSKNVYYQPPESLKIKYPAIRYTKSRIDKRSADDGTYTLSKSYEIIVISDKADDPAIEKLLELPMCSFDRHYKADNLNHDVFTLYY